jgi:hypothetical protein
MVDSRLRASTAGSPHPFCRPPRLLPQTNPLADPPWSNSSVVFWNNFLNTGLAGSFFGSWTASTASCTYDSQPYSYQWHQFTGLPAEVDPWDAAPFV